MNTADRSIDALLALYRAARVLRDLRWQPGTLETAARVGQALAELDRRVDAVERVAGEMKQ